MPKIRDPRLRALAILAAGLSAALLLVVLKPEPHPERPPPPPPHVAEVVRVQLASLPVVVASQGTVRPKIAVELAAEVAGRVVEVGEHFAVGGFFSAGERLLALDARDYEIALARAEAELAEARRALAEERGRARQARREWRDLGDPEANALFLRKPQLAAAEARVAAAEAGVRKARLDLERTRIAAPFAGRVVEVAANLGQYVAPGQKVAAVYAAERMEVALPLTAEELARLNLHPAGRHHELSPLAVDLFFRAGSQVLHWEGRAVRLAAEVERDTRLFHLVVEVANRLDVPAEGEEASGPPPILPGLFVEALITSNPHPGVAALPRSALFRADQVLVLDEESRLRTRQVEVLEADADRVVVRGLAEGMRVLVKPPAFLDLGAVYEALEAVGAEAP